MIRGLFVVLALAAPTFQLNLLPYAPKGHAKQYLPPGWVGMFAHLNEIGSAWPQVAIAIELLYVNGTRAKREPTTENQRCGIQSYPVPLPIGGPSSLEGQWPWHVALFQTQKVGNKYICGGTLVSTRHVITAAHCVTRRSSNTPVDKRTLTVYLGKANLRTSYEGVQIKLVEKITVHPDFEKTTYKRNVAILEFKEPVSFTAWVRPACLWPDDQEDLSIIVGKKGSVVGWGLDENQELRTELRLVEMPVVDPETCIRSYSEFYARFTSEFTYCAGNINGVSLCNGDSGGGMVFKNVDTWYLRGLVSLSIAKKDELTCDPSHYVIFTDIAKVLPWVKENVGNL